MSVAVQTSAQRERPARQRQEGAMSERGVFALDRGIFDHPVFADEAFTEREAWAWLIAEAAWKPRVRRVAHGTVSLARGQLAASIRFLGERWGWRKGRAERFLARLKAEAMIETRPETGISVITICNYARYQRVALPDAVSSETPSETPNGTAGGTAPGQQRDSGGTKQKTLNASNDDVARAREPPVSAQAVALAEDIAAIAGLAARGDWPPGWSGAALRAQAFLDHGWRPDVMLASARATMARKRDGPPQSIRYFERPFAQAHAAQAAPLPEIHAPRFTQVPHAAARSPLMAAIEQHIECLAGRDRPAGEDPARLLSHRRGQ